MVKNKGNRETHTKTQLERHSPRGKFPGNFWLKEVLGKCTSQKMFFKCHN